MTTASQPAQTLLDLYDEAPLDGRYWRSMAILAVGSIVDYFDFYIVGFILAVVGPQWHLTYGQSSLLLLGGGFGAIAGAVASGVAADRWGRKPALVGGMALAGIASAAIALLPEGAWWMFAVLRFLVGFGIAAVAAPTVALSVEYTPTRLRIVLSSLLVVSSGIGIMAAAAVAASLLSTFGWRGIAAVGIAPLLMALLAAAFVPESLRWLIATGRTERAQRAATRLMPGSPVILPPAAPLVPPPESSSLGGLFAERRAFWLVTIVFLAISTANYGVYLWGPTIVALVLGIPIQQAAGIFIYVALAGIAGKIAFSVLPQRIGRRSSGILAGLGITVSLGAAALFYDATWFGQPAFVVLIILGALFFDGAFSNAVPYAAEVFEVRLAARGTGLSQAANGIGEIVGPMSLALIAGTSNLLTPTATTAAILPGFLFLAGCGLASALAFLLIPIETRGRTLEVGPAAPTAAAVPGQAG